MKEKSKPARFKKPKHAAPKFPALIKGAATRRGAVEKRRKSNQSGEEGRRRQSNF